MTAPRSTRLTTAEEAVLRREPHLHIPRLVLERDTNGVGFLDRFADLISGGLGSMWTFVIVSIGIVVWLFAGNVVGFDKTPWPLLLTLLNLPQLSIMVSLQVAANRAQAASDARAIASYETLTALDELNKQQLEILRAQDAVLDTLRRAVAGGSSTRG
jgi:uncharacterized membrane protein